MSSPVAFWPQIKKDSEVHLGNLITGFLKQPEENVSELTEK